MLTSFGNESQVTDENLKGLSVKLVPLQNGEFYHFGSNEDLINSSLRLQNRISDQRLKHTRESDHHPSIFQQNSQIALTFTDENHHIWVENSYLPATWKLNHHHIFTGIPENKWTLDIPGNICLDLVPVDTDEYCVRSYGFSDTFRDTLETGAQWMEESLQKWLDDRSVKPGQAGIDPHTSLFELPLFPVVHI